MRSAASSLGRLLYREGRVLELKLVSKPWESSWRSGAQKFPRLSQQLLHVYADRLSLEDRRNRDRDETFRMRSLPSSSFAVPMTVRNYHPSPTNERAVAIILGLGAVSAASYAASSAVRAYKDWKASLPEPSPETLEEEVQENKESQKTQQKVNESDEPEPRGGDRENIFAKWFGVGVGAKYYEGGFEDTMTRREAALILGVRESSSPARIKEAHRKLLILNHPDTGGSTYISGKINEAKELLLKGKRGV